MFLNHFIFAYTIILLHSFKLCLCKTYKNYSLYNVVPQELDHLKFLQNIEKQKYIDVMFWTKPHKLFEEVQLLVNPEDVEQFKERARHYKINIQLLLSDVQSAFDKQILRKYYPLREETYSWDTYHDLEDIYQWLADIAVKYPDIVKKESIGKSAEGRDILGISIRKDAYLDKPKVIAEGGIHGHEWIAIEFVVYLVNELARSFEIENLPIMNLIEKHHWYIVPVVNPDGFVYTQKEDRLWRKNRRPLDNTAGVDLNRNFDYSFGKHDTSYDPTHDHFCGRNAFSEPESKSLADFITNRNENLKFYFSFHSYGQKIIIPYGDRVKHIENYIEMENYGNQAILKMHKVNGVTYKIGTVYDTLSQRISGNTASWVKKQYNVPYVFTFLLRDNGTYGFALPPSYIKPTCEETMVGLMQLMTAKMRPVKLSFGKGSSHKIRSGFIILLFNAVYL